MTEPRIIHHLAPASELRAGLRDGRYAPSSLAADGFVHCSAGRETTLAVASDYFGDVDEPLMVLEIDRERLTARCVFEAPAPIPGGGSAHLERAQLFPHVYGPLNVDAIRGVAELGRAGVFRWPARFDPIADFASGP